MSEKQPNPSMTFRFSDQEVSLMKASADSWADALRGALEKWSSALESGDEAAMLKGEPDENLKAYTLRMPEKLRSDIEVTAKRLGRTKAWVVRKVWELYG